MSSVSWAPHMRQAQGQVLAAAPWRVAGAVQVAERCGDRSLAEGGSTRCVGRCGHRKLQCSRAARGLCGLLFSYKGRASFLRRKPCGCGVVQGAGGSQRGWAGPAWWRCGQRGLVHKYPGCPFPCWWVQGPAGPEVMQRRAAALPGGLGRVRQLACPAHGF